LGEVGGVGAEDQFPPTDCIDEVVIGFQNLDRVEVWLEVVGVGFTEHEVKKLVAFAAAVAEASAA